MGDNSQVGFGIEHTWNPWYGCTRNISRATGKVSPGCVNCYMYRQMKAFGKIPHVVQRAGKQSFNKPVARDRRGNYRWKPNSRIFTCSWSDYFHPEADEWRPESWEIIAKRHDMTFVIITKFSDRIAERLPGDWGDGYPNVWLMVTVEDGNHLYRADDLMNVKSAVRGIFAEPLLGHLIIPSGIDWVVAGGESGPGARPLRSDWVRSIQDQCELSKIPFYFKQWGEYAPDSDFQMKRVGRKKAGRILDGREWDEFPKQ